jgi:hypothetical protein
VEQRSRPPASAGTRAKLTGFDYTQLPLEVAEAARQSAEHIRISEQNRVRARLEIGRELIKVKEALGHGKFRPWLKAEFGWSERMAQRYVGAAEKLGEKADTVSDLGAKAVYALSAKSTPQETRDDIVARLEHGEPLTTQAVVAELKAAQTEPKVGAESSAVEEPVLEPGLDEASATHSTGQGQPGQDQQDDAATPAQRAADLILEQLNQGREDLALLLEDADEHEFVERLRQGLAVRSRQAA